MPDLFDRDKASQQVILKLSDIRQEKEEEGSTEEAEESSTPKSTEAKREEMAAKVAAAKLHANREIKQFREAVERFCGDLTSTCLFHTMPDSVRYIFIDQVLEMVIEPILKGKQPIGMPDEAFRAIRADMYKQLIKNYVDNE